MVHRCGAAAHDGAGAGLYRRGVRLGQELQAVVVFCRMSGHRFLVPPRLALPRHTGGAAARLKRCRDKMPDLVARDSGTLLDSAIDNVPVACSHVPEGCQDCMSECWTAMIGIRA